MAKRIPYWSNDRKIFPMTKTDYVKKGGKGVKVNETKELISRNQSKNVLNKTGLPFERSHRLTVQDHYKHSEPYDTFQSIGPSGDRKTVWYVDFPTGYRNYYKLRDKHYANKRNYQERKNNKPKK